jgi:hypothetical protein
MNPRSVSTRLGLLSLLLAAPAAASSLDFSGFLALGGAAFEGDRSWLVGGSGKLLGSDDDAGGLGELRLGLDWEPSPVWHLHLDAQARLDLDSDASRDAGLVEAWAEATWGFGAGHELGVRGGQFFPRTSFENVEPLWSSPYTLTLSAWNSWIAEEVRPTGIELGYRKFTAREHQLALAGTVFTGNDTAGVLLAWRGWSMHDRVVVREAFQPVPRLDSLDGIFSAQDGRGTKPLGGDLDGRPGWLARGEWAAPGGRARLQVTGYDNRGDRRLHGHEYAWRTRFGLVGGEAELAAGLRLAGEWGWGSTSMGPATDSPGKPFNVFADFAAGYLLLAWQNEAWTATLRHDRFEVEDRDRQPRAEDNDEDGSAWTVALLWNPIPSWRLGLELLDLTADRDEIGPGRRGGKRDGRSLRGELRWRF